MFFAAASMRGTGVPNKVSTCVICLSLSGSPSCASFAASSSATAASSSSTAAASFNAST